MAKARDILASGALGIGPALLAKNPEGLKAFGLLGNLAYNKLEDKEDRKRKAAMTGMPEENVTGMKKGGKVKMSSAAKRADGICKKGHTRGKMV
jgi:hypothetical protein